MLTQVQLEQGLLVMLHPPHALSGVNGVIVTYLQLPVAPWPTKLLFVGSNTSVLCPHQCQQGRQAVMTQAGVSGEQPYEDIPNHHS